jgi:hypothetical protein
MDARTGLLITIFIGLPAFTAGSLAVIAFWPDSAPAKLLAPIKSALENLTGLSKTGALAAAIVDAKAAAQSSGQGSGAVSPMYGTAQAATPAQGTSYIGGGGVAAPIEGKPVVS